MVAMLYGLQTASSNLKRTNPQPNWDEVEMRCAHPSLKARATSQRPNAAPCNGFEQEVWHKNIAVDTARQLFEADLADNHGTIPGAGLNKKNVGPAGEMYLAPTQETNDDRGTDPGKRKVS